MGLLNPVTTVLPLRDSLQGRDRSGLFSATATGPVRYREEDGLEGYWAEGGTTNLFTNPTAGVVTTGWGAGANRTLTRETSLPGPLPDGLATIVTTGFLVVADQDFASGADILSCNVTLNSAAHSAAFYVWIPSVWTGGQLALQANDFAGVGGTTSINLDMSTRDQWQRVRLENWTPASGDLAGRVVLRCTASPGFLSGQYVYIAANQLEQKPYTTSYCPLLDPLTGNPLPGYSWAGTPHYSASVRAATVLTFDPAGRVDNDSFAMAGRFSLDSITDRWQAIASAGKQDIGNFFGVFNRDDGRFSAKSNGGYAEDSLTFTPGSPQITYAAGQDTDWVAQLDENDVIAETRGDGGAWSNNYVYVGSSNNGDYLNGSVGPVAFYDRPLTDVELDKVKAAISLGRNPWGLLAPKKQYSFFQLRPGV